MRIYLVNPSDVAFRVGVITRVGCMCSVLLHQHSTVCVHFRYGPMTCSPSLKMALSTGFGNSVSLLSAIQATRF